MTRGSVCRFCQRTPAAGAIIVEFSFPVAWSTPMTQKYSALFVACYCSLSLAGCAYDQSFMQMDSNSGVPFFGMQWAVDSGSRPSGHTDSSMLKLSEQDSELNIPIPRIDRRKSDKSDTSRQLVNVSQQSH
ncbi:MAG: hypothetical protein U0936_23000 [Planctomycetaceae bacterium]